MVTKSRGAPVKTGSELSNSVRAVRNRLGMSQQQLADLAGVKRQTISGIEGSLYAPSAAVALRIARALGCRVEDLFWFEDNLPIVEAAPVGAPASVGGRVSLAQIGGHWVAQELQRERAFRSEIVPADGLVVGSAGSAVRVKLLDDPEALGRTVVLAGCTPSLSIWARSAERWHPGLRVQWTHANSTEALRSLARGEVHAAGVHLCDPITGEQNLPFVRTVIPGRAVVLLNLGVWDEGLIVAEGNPRGVRGVKDLAGGRVRIVNRETGAGSRLLLDTFLTADGIERESVKGYGIEMPGHQEVAHAVAAGHADAAISTAAVAMLYGLSFVGLRRVRYDLAILEDYLQSEPVRQLLGTLHHRWVRSQLQALGGYDTTETGQVIGSTHDSPADSFVGDPTGSEPRERDVARRC
ncbi:MAG TPA: substrate-binding domain-containing protein [Armatimonadota bacterium]|nr:substrate-binding domain-containing protein [Armatimonadota bacterium]